MRKILATAIDISLRMFYACIALAVFITMNFAFCDATITNKKTIKIERKVDSFSNPQRFKRIKQGNGLQRKNIQRINDFPNPIPNDSNFYNF